MGIVSTIARVHLDLETTPRTRHWAHAISHRRLGSNPRSAERQLPPRPNRAPSGECPTLPTPTPCRELREPAQPSESAASNRRLEIPTLAAHLPQMPTQALAHKTLATARHSQWPKTE